MILKNALNIFFKSCKELNQIMNTEKNIDQ